MIHYYDKPNTTHNVYLVSWWRFPDDVRKFEAHSLRRNYDDANFPTSIHNLIYVSRNFISQYAFLLTEHPGNNSSFAGDGSWRGNHRHSLYFPVAVPDAEDITVDHASLRFLLLGDHQSHPRDLEILIYLRTPVSRRLLLRRRISQMEPKDPRWLELDSTEAAASWLEGDPDENHGLELEFLHDDQPTQREISHVRLNVFVASDAIDSGGDRLRRKRSTPEELMPLHKSRRSKCKGDNNKKCCRHELTVMFKDLKGFDFIVYPKGFDAGYCKGRCPPRYNPAHHHALLQSLLWKEDRKRVPKPCCAPSKLDQLMIVYFDENDSTQLKVSYWKNIQVLECACSWEREREKSETVYHRRGLTKESSASWFDAAVCT